MIRHTKILHMIPLEASAPLYPIQNGKIYRCVFIFHPIFIKLEIKAFEPQGIEKHEVESHTPLSPTQKGKI